MSVPRRASKTGSSREKGEYSKRCSACDSPVKATWRRCPRCRIATPAEVDRDGVSVFVAAGGGTVLKASFAYAAQECDEPPRYFGESCGAGTDGSRAQSSTGLFRSAHEPGGSSADSEGKKGGAKASGMCEQAGGGGGDAKQGSGDAALYDIGLWWIVHNNKMVVAGFEPTCRGRELGVRPVFLDKSVYTHMDTSVHTRTWHSMRHVHFAQHPPGSGFRV